ncbi:hypothetical protein TKK_0014945 [Trichogramma kaykai]|uniref:G-protein coupled receptors family 1 profile domain-containing protein n=1 Tax=Trichogramma kaykai TaxID=54128 RepID=A0ABD2WCT9_9HYME
MDNLTRASENDTDLGSLLLVNLTQQRNNATDDEGGDYLPDWTDLFLAACFSLLIVVTIVGNTLVIAAVITTRRLRSVTNCFVSSLAAADLLVGLAVMPPAVLLQLNGGEWELGEILCDSWVSLDVLLCTASILSLCAISIDRYLAVTQPLIYSRRRRSKRLAGLMIVVVWISAGAITSPPLLGCFPMVRNSLEIDKKCSYNMDRSYVVFSAMGSFFLPMLVMLYVYGRISCVIAKRHRSLETSDSSAAAPHHHHHHQQAGEHQGKFDSGGFPRAHKRSVIRRNCPQASSTKLAKSSLRQALSSRLSVSEYGTTSDATSTAAAPASSKPATTSSTTLQVPSLDVASSGNDHGGGGGPSSPTTTESSGGPTTLLSPSRGSAKPSGLARLGTIRSHQHSSCINRVTRETKTAGTLAVVVGGFVLCWLPFFILYLATPFVPVAPPDALMPALTWLGWINSAINPFIYAFYSADFRMAFWRLTCRHCFRDSGGRFDVLHPNAEHRGQMTNANWRQQTSRT